MKRAAGRGWRCAWTPARPRGFASPELSAARRPGSCSSTRRFVAFRRTEGRALLAACRSRWSTATLVCVTHDLTAARTFDRVLVVEDGRLVEDGAPAALACQPEQPATCAGGRRGAACGRARLGRSPRLRGSPTLPRDPAPPRRSPAVAGREVRVLAAGALLAGTAATAAVVLGASALGDGLKPEATAGWPVWGRSWRCCSRRACSRGVAALIAGRAAVALGRRLRERALDRILHGDARYARRRRARTAVGPRTRSRADREPSRSAPARWPSSASSRSSRP